MMQAVYVFALTDHAIPSFAVAGHRVEFVDLAGLHAAVERRSDLPAVSESSLRTQHDIVTRLSDRIDAVVPARFGALIDERELREMLAARRQVIQEALTLVRGRVQMTVRFNQARESMPDRSPSSAAPMSGTAYLEARRSAARTMPALAGVVGRAIADLAIAERSEAGSETSAPVLYHLIGRDSVGRYTDAVSGLTSPALSVSGPWPPFAFAPDVWP